MLVIRLFRVGKKNQPAFKIVVTEKTRPPRGGRFVEEVGFYNPLTKQTNLKTERIKYWISVGAKPLATVFNMLVKEKVIEGKKISVHKKSKKKGSEAPILTVVPVTTAATPTQAATPAAATPAPAPEAEEPKTETTETAQAVQESKAEPLVAENPETEASKPETPAEEPEVKPEEKKEE